MSAVLPLVETIAYSAGTLDVQRLLRMGQTATARLYKPDPNAIDRRTLVREYSHGFCRMTANERQLAEGRTIIFEFADLGVTGEYPVGQLVQDFKDGNILIVDESGGSYLYIVQDVEAPAPEKKQVYVVTCESRRFIKSYTRP